MSRNLLISKKECESKAILSQYIERDFVPKQYDKVVFIKETTKWKIGGKYWWNLRLTLLLM